jgi:hypothetical protein
MTNQDIQEIEDDLAIDPEDEDRKESLSKAFVGKAPSGLRAMNAATADAMYRTKNGLLSGSAGMFDIAAYVLLHDLDANKYREALHSSFEIDNFREIVLAYLEGVIPSELIGRADEIKASLTDWEKICTGSNDGKKKKRAR